LIDVCAGLKSVGAHEDHVVERAERSGVVQPAGEADVICGDAHRGLTERRSSCSRAMAISDVRRLTLMAGSVVDALRGDQRFEEDRIDRRRCHRRRGSLPCD